MAATIIYAKAGTDPTRITWPPRGASRDQFSFTDGVATTVAALIGHGDGSITFADGRAFPTVTPQGSTFTPR